jgi:hypothetical protein
VSTTGFNGRKLDRAEVTVTVGEPDQRGQATVSCLNAGERRHIDRFDPLSDFHRGKFAEASYARLPADLQFLIEREAPDNPAPWRFIADLVIQGSSASGERDDQITYPVITAADLATTLYDVEFFIDGLVPVGQPQGRFGAKKALKTTLACAEGFSIATGLSFLNYFRVNRTARVGFFSGESGMGTIQETMLRIARSFDTDLAQVDMVFSDRLPMLGDLRHMDALEKYILDNGIELLYVDPAYLAMLTAGNEGSLFAMGALLRSLSELCQRVKCTPILLHHMRKSVVDPYSPGDLDDASWSGFAEFCRSWMLINRREKYLPGSGCHRLWLSVGGSIGHGGLWGLNIEEGQYTGPGSRIWQVEVVKAEDVRDEVAESAAAAREEKQNDKLAQSKRAFVRALAKHPGGETVKAIRDAAGLSGTIATMTLAALIEEGAVVACDVSKPNRKAPYEGYRLNLEGANQ